MKLTVSMATFDDYDGVYFTIQSLRLHQHLFRFDHEILVLDNNPGGEHSAALHNLSKNIKTLRVIDCGNRKSSFIKYDAITHATGDIILGLDCHVLLEPGFVKSLLEHWQSNTASRDMVSGPLIYDDLGNCSTHMEPTWRGIDYGTWGDDPEGMATEQPFEIPMQGMGCFSVLRANFPKINREFRGFGGEEWYIAEKIRQNGGQVLCHPRLGWLHRFEWPKRAFPLTTEDRLFNYYLGWLELYGTEKHPMVKSITDHWSTTAFAHLIEPVLTKAKAALTPRHRSPQTCGTPS